MVIQFTKFQGTGNDFILVDNRKSGIKLGAKSISLLCNRNFGIGSDGLLLLEDEKKYDFRMVFFNPDGSPARMCGNGARCITVFGSILGIKKEEYSFIAGDGLHRSRIVSAGEHSSIVRVTLQDPLLTEEDENHLILNTGTPHYVIFMQQAPPVEKLRESAREIRYSEKYRNEGINIDFVWIETGGIRVMTYERGVEDFTLSCGTGVTAAAVGAVIRKKHQPPVRVSTDGGELTVDFEMDEEKIRNVWLEGPVKKVFDGTIEITE